jgi:hypothetical protein
MQRVYKFLIKLFVFNICLMLFLIPSLNYIEASSGGSGDVVHLQSPININSPTELAAAVIRWIMSIVGIASVAAMVYAGILYFTSGGNEDQAGKAKKTMTYAIIGLIVAILSYVIINTLINAIGG